MTAQLPEPPEGYFWRITRLSLTTIPLVQLRRKTWFFSECRDELAVWNDEELPWEAATERIAWKILQRHKERAERNSFMAKAEGDYPPKSSADW